MRCENLKHLHRLWLKINDSDEYDVKYGSWMIYQAMYKNNLNFTDDDIIRTDGRPYIQCKFMHNGNESEVLKFSGETDFNFSNRKKRELCRSRYYHYRKILERDLEGEPILDIYVEMLNECVKKHHSQDNISLMPMSGNLQGAKGSVGLDRLDVWLLILDMKYSHGINLLKNHCTMEKFSEIDSFLDLFDDVCDYTQTIYHIDSTLTRKLIELGKIPLDTADAIIEYMSLAMRFWEQKNQFIESQLNK